MKNIYTKEPVSNVKWVAISKIEPNDYNPNVVDKETMKLLYISILNDGYTQPIVTIYNSKIKKYVIVDGYHRYLVMKHNKNILERTNGKLPIVVIKKSINDLVASTIRHNRARGKHTITGMSDIIFKMLHNGWNDIDICNNLGMEAEELLRLKHITGFSKLFSNIDYGKSWKTKKQILIEREYKNGNYND